MNPHLTFKQYRRMDLFFFALILTVSETLIILAGNRWFREQLYTVSAVAAVVGIVLARWGTWAGIHAVLGGMVYCLAGKANPYQFLIYCAGNLLSLLGVFYLRHFGLKRIREDLLLTILYALCIQLLMQLGVEEAEAAEEACRIEHDISQDTFEKLKVWAKEKGVE